MSNGDKGDPQGLAAEVAAAVRAQLNELQGGIADSARAISELEQKVQLSHAATTQTDQRWEQRITALETRLVDLDESLRSEVERVRGSASVLDLLGQEFRTTMGDTRDLAGVAGDLATRMAELEAAASAAREAGAGIAGLDDRLAQLSAEITAPSNRLDINPILGAFDGFAAQLDLIRDEMSRFADDASIPDSGLADVERRLADLTAQLQSMAEPDPVVPAGLDSIRERLDRLDREPPDLGPIAAKLDALDQQLTQIATSPSELAPVTDAIAQLGIEVAAIRDAQPDLSPVLDRLLTTASREQIDDLADRVGDSTALVAVENAIESVRREVRELAASDLDLSAVTEQLATIRAEVRETSEQSIQPDRVEELFDQLDSRVEALTAAQVDAASLSRQLEPLEGIERLDAAIQGLRSDVIAVQAAQPDLSPALERLMSVPSRDQLDSIADQIEDSSHLEPIHDAIRLVRDEIIELRGRPTDLSPVIDLIESLDLDGRLGLLTDQASSANPLLAEIRKVDLRLSPLADALQTVASRLGGLETAAASGRNDVNHQSIEIRALGELTDALLAASGEQDERVDALTSMVKDLLEQSTDPALILDRIQLIIDHVTREVEPALDADRMARLEELGLDVSERVGAVIDQVTELEAKPALRADPADLANTIVSALDDSHERHAEQLASIVSSLADRDTRLIASANEQLAAISALAGTDDQTSAAMQRLGDAQARHASQLDGIEQQLRHLADRSQDPEIVLERIRGLHERLEEESVVISSTRDDLRSIAGQVSESRTRQVMTETVDRVLADAATRVDPVLEQLAEISTNIEQLRTEQTPLDEPLQAIAARIEETIATTAAEIDRAAAERATQDRASLAAVVAAIPDPMSQIADLRAAVHDVLAERDDFASSVIEIGQRTDQSIENIRRSIDERLGSIIEAGASDAAAVTDAVAGIAARERIVLDHLEAINGQLVELGRTEGDDDRLARLLQLTQTAGVEHGDALAGISAAAAALAEAQRADRETVLGLAEALGAVRSETEALNRHMLEVTGSSLDIESALTPVVQSLLHLTTTTEQTDLQLSGITDAVAAIAPHVDRTGASIVDITARIEQQVEAQSAATSDVVTRIGPAVDEVRDVVRRTESTLVEQTSTLERIEDGTTQQRLVLAQLDQRSSDLAEALDQLAGTSSRLDDLAELRSGVASLSERIDAVGGLGTKLIEIEERIESVHAALATDTEHVVGRIEASRNDTREFQALLSDQADLSRDTSEQRLASLTSHTESVAGEMAELRTDVHTQQRDLLERLTALEQTSTSALDVAREIASATSGPGYGELVDRLDAAEARDAAAVSALQRTVLDARTFLGDQIETLAASAHDDDAAALAAATEARLDEIGEQQREHTVAMLRAVDSQAVKVEATLENITAAISALDQAVGGRVDAIADGTMASEERIAGSLNGLHGLLGSLDLNALVTRIDTLEEQISDSDSSLHAAMSSFREATLGIDLTPVEAALAELSVQHRDGNAGLDGRIASLRDLVAEIDVSPFEAALERIAVLAESATNQLDTLTDEQRRSGRATEQALEMFSSSEASSVADIASIANAVAALDAGLADRVSTIADETVAAELRIAESIANLHSVIGAFDLDPILRRVDALELQIEESDTGLHAAVGGLRDATLGLDFSPIEARIGQLDTQSREISTDLTERLADVAAAVASIDLSSIESELGRVAGAVDSGTSGHRDVMAAVAGLAEQIDLETVNARLEALSTRADDAFAVERATQDTVGEIRRHVATFDVDAIVADLDRLTEAMHTGTETSRSILSNEIAGVTELIRDIDLESVQRRLDAIETSGERLAETISTEFAAASTGTVLERLDQIRERVGQIRDDVEHGNETGDAQARLVTDRIDALGNAFVDRLEAARAQTDGLAAQVASVHSTLASSDADPATLRSHLDRAIDDLSGRMLNAIRDLRNDIASESGGGDAATMRTSIETSLGRLSQRLDADVKRILDALDGSDDGDRLRRIDSSITEIRRDFEVLRRLSDRAVPTGVD